MRGEDFEVEFILAYLKTFEAEVVILDPLYSFFNGEENSASDMNEFLKILREVSEKGNVAIFFAHHDPKSGSGQRETHERGAGSSVLGRYYDACFTLDRHNNNDDSDLVVSSLFRSYPPQDDISVRFTNGGFFELLDMPAVKKKKRSNENPRNSMDNTELAKSALKLLGKKVLRPTELESMLQKDLQIGVKKSGEVRRALEELPGIARGKQGSRYEYVGLATELHKRDDLKIIRENPTKQIRSATVEIED